MSAYFILGNPLLDGDYLLLFLGFLMFSFMLIVFIVGKEEFEIQKGIKDDFEHRNTIRFIVLNMFIACSITSWISFNYGEAKRDINFLNNTIGSKKFKCITPTEKSLLKARYDAINKKNKITPFYSFSDLDIVELYNDVVLCKKTLDDYFVLAPIKKSELNHIENIKSYMLKKHHVLLVPSVRKKYWLVLKNVASKYGKQEVVRFLKDAVPEVKNENIIEEKRRKSWDKNLKQEGRFVDIKALFPKYNILVEKIAKVVYGNKVRDGFVMSLEDWKAKKIAQDLVDEVGFPFTRLIGDKKAWFDRSDAYCVFTRDEESLSKFKMEKERSYHD